MDLAKKIHRGGTDWDRGFHSEHGVNFSQGFREPAEYYLQSGDPKDLPATVRNYRTVMDVYGQFPGGGFAADENCRPGYVDPRQGFETCSWVEFMHSFEMLTKISGNPLWADRCEEIAFNSFPASMSPDLKGLHYLTAPNQPQLDRLDKSPGIQNGGADVHLQPLGIPLLPAQRVARLAVLCRRALAGDGRQGPLRLALRRLGSDREGWRRHGGYRGRNDRLSV